MNPVSCAKACVCCIVNNRTVLFLHNFPILTWNYIFEINSKWIWFRFYSFNAWVINTYLYLHIFMSVNLKLKPINHTMIWISINLSVHRYPKLCLQKGSRATDLPPWTPTFWRIKMSVTDVGTFHVSQITNRSPTWHVEHAVNVISILFVTNIMMLPTSRK